MYTFCFFRYMIRTQIYLTKKEKKALHDLALQSGKRQSELIREAIDDFIAKSSQNRIEHVLNRVAGLWKDHQSVLNFKTLRKSWNRNLGA